MEKWMVYAIVSMVFAGITSVLAKYGMEGMKSDTALAIRTAMVFVFIMANAFLFRSAWTELQHVSWRSFSFLAISAATTSLSWIFYYRAMKLGPVSYVASIDKASIVITLLLSFVLLKEPMSAKLLLGAGLILSGMLVLVWK